MATKSKIEWTDQTWNPVTGCTKVSPGCAHCYAERMHRRLQGKGVAEYARDFDEVDRHWHRLQDPYRWRKPRMVFVNSMSDLFHERVGFAFIKRVVDVIRDNPQHVFQVLTKRSVNMLSFDRAMKTRWPDNLWLGVSVESQRYVSRVDDLRETRAKVKFVSAEPLLGAVNFPNLLGVHWMIVGGESGPGWRDMNPDWAHAIRNQCSAAGVAFFMKQMAGKKEIPYDLLIRQFPEQVSRNEL